MEVDNCLLLLLLLLRKRDEAAAKAQNGEVRLGSRFPHGIFLGSVDQLETELELAESQPTNKASSFRGEAPNHRAHPAKAAPFFRSATGQSLTPLVSALQFPFLALL